MPRKRKTIIHVNQHNLRKNAKDHGDRPVLIARTYKDVQYGHEIELTGPARVVYRPHKPLSCGARAWIETHSEVIVK